MLRINLFSIFTIKTPRALTTALHELASLCLLIVKTLTNLLYYVQIEQVLVRQVFNSGRSNRVLLRYFIVAIKASWTF